MQLGRRLTMDEKGRCVATTVRILGKRVPKKENMGFSILYLKCQLLCREIYRAWIVIVSRAGQSETGKEGDKVN